MTEWTGLGPPEPGGPPTPAELAAAAEFTELIAGRRPPASVADMMAALDATPWEVTITRMGRWSWEIALSKGLMVMGSSWGGGPPVVYGTRARADRIGRRWLAKHNRKDRQQRESWRIT